MFEEENRLRAEAYVERHLGEMKEKLKRDGYFVYDEYETIYIHTGRYIPNILNNKLKLSGDDALSALEFMLEEEGNCGIIVERWMLERREKLKEILKEFYKNKY